MCSCVCWFYVCTTKHHSFTHSFPQYANSSCRITRLRLCIRLTVIPASFPILSPVCIYLHSVYSFVITPHYKNMTQGDWNGNVCVCKSSVNDFGKRIETDSWRWQTLRLFKHEKMLITNIGIHHRFFGFDSQTKADCVCICVYLQPGLLPSFIEWWIQTPGEVESYFSPRNRTYVLTDGLSLCGVFKCRSLVLRHSSRHSSPLILSHLCL